MTEGERRETWWRPERLAAGEGLRLALDRLDLCVFRARGEWQVAHVRRPADWQGPEGGLAKVDEISDELHDRARFTSDGATDEVRLVPRVADRSVVARPRVGLYVLPGGIARIYVSSPVWLEVTVGESARSLLELPVKRLSDTWFGPSTREGVVAYSLKTQARTKVDDVKQVSYRVITPVAVRNESEELLTVDQLNLPVPYLSIYCDEADHLWTETVVLKHGGEDQLAGLEVRDGAPSEADGARRLSGPRERASDNVFVRAFSSLLRPFEVGDR